MADTGEGGPTECIRRFTELLIYPRPKIWTWGTRLQGFQIRLRALQLWKEPFFRLEFPRVHAAASVLCFHWMPEVQHLVIHQIFDRVARCISAIEDSAYHDRIVRGVVVAQETFRRVLAPGELRTPQQSVEE